MYRCQSYQGCDEYWGGDVKWGVDDDEDGEGGWCNVEKTNKKRNEKQKTTKKVNDDDDDWTNAEFNFPQQKTKTSLQINNDKNKTDDLIDFSELEVKTSKNKTKKKSLDDDAWAMLEG